MSEMPAYDAIVVGSGCNGGVAAMELTRAGLKVLVLEAGPRLKGPGVYGTQAGNLARQLSQRWFTKHQPIQELHGGYWETNPKLFIDDTENPYTTPEGKPFKWIRGRQVGGRSHTWGGVTLRFSDYEFKAASRDGIGQDWPISTADLSPYYDRIETVFRAHGSREGLAQLPDGQYLEPAKLSPGEEVFRDAVEKEFGRRVIVSRGIHAHRAAEKGEQYTRLSSNATTLVAAAETGHLTLQSDAVVARVLVDETTGRASGVEYVDRGTKELHAAHAKAVFLCASTIESLRILMMSKSPSHPDGIGARSGLLGKGIMDHIVSNVFFHMPRVKETDGYELLGSDSILVPRYQNLNGAPAKHKRGFGLWGGIHRLKFPGVLRRHKDIAFGFLCVMGEALPDEANLVRLDADVKDHWGLPAPYIDCRWTESDLQLAAEMRAQAEEMVKAAGGELTSLPEAVHTPLVGGFMKGMQKQWELTVPGLFVHEVGGARMGSDPATSVVNPMCQVWEAPNVFVTDGACWVSSGWQNPTLTEMAITARACEHAVKAMARRDI